MLCIVCRGVLGGKSGNVGICMVYVRMDGLREREQGETVSMIRIIV